MTRAKTPRNSDTVSAPGPLGSDVDAQTRTGDAGPSGVDIHNSLQGVGRAWSIANTDIESRIKADGRVGDFGGKAAVPVQGLTNGSSKCLGESELPTKLQVDSLALCSGHLPAEEKQGTVKPATLASSSSSRVESEVTADTQKAAAAVSASNPVSAVGGSKGALGGILKRLELPSLWPVGNAAPAASPDSHGGPMELSSLWADLKPGRTAALLSSSFTRREKGNTSLPL